MKLPFRKHYFFILTFLLSTALIYTSIVIPIQKAEQYDPGSSFYGFPWVNATDFYEYIYMIRSGTEGKMLFHNVYTEEPFPPILAETIYNVVGFVTAPLGQSPYYIYRLFQFTGIGLLLISTMILIHKTIKRQEVAVLALILASTATIGHRPEVVDGTLRFVIPEIYSNHVDIFRKFNMAPIHHFIEIVLLIAAIFVFSKASASPRKLLITGILGILTAFIHPYVGIAAVLIIAANFLLDTLIHRKINRQLLIQTIIFCGLGSGVILYFGWLMKHIWGTSEANMGSISWEPRMYTSLTFFSSLAPLVLTSLFGLLNPKTYKDPKLRLVALWALSTPLVFYFPDLHLPYKSFRVFELFPYIPFAILTAAGLGWILEKWPHVLKNIILLMVGTLATIYAFYTYKIFFDDLASPNQKYFTYVTPARKMNTPIFDYLEKNIPPNQVILTEEVTGYMIPAFTHDRIIIGHNASNRNYSVKKGEADTFFWASLTDEERISYLKRYRVDYIIFSIDTPSFDEPRFQVPYLQKIYSENGATLVKVNLGS